MLHFDEQVASDLEFDRIRILLAAKTLQPTAESRALALTPIKNRRSIVKTLSETEELRRIKVEGEPFPALEFEEMQNAQVSKPNLFLLETAKSKQIR